MLKNKEIVEFPVIQKFHNHSSLEQEQKSLTKNTLITDEKNKMCYLVIASQLSQS